MLAELILDADIGALLGQLLMPVGAKGAVIRGLSAGARRLLLHNRIKSGSGFGSGSSFSVGIGVGSGFGIGIDVSFGVSGRCQLRDAIHRRCCRC